MIGATKVDVISTILIKFVDTIYLNDERKVYDAKKVAGFCGDRYKIVWWFILALG